MSQPTTPFTEAVFSVGRRHKSGQLMITEDFLKVRAQEAVLHARCRSLDHAVQILAQSGYEVVGEWEGPNDTTRGGCWTVKIKEA